MTVDPEMMKILQNLENAQSIHEKKIEDRAKGKHVVNESSQEMYDILKRLEDATTNVSKQLVTEAKTNTKTAAGLIKDSSITMGSYNVVMEKKNVTEKYRKTYYTITDNKSNVIHEDIALFESAMGILKELVTGKTVNTKKIIELDNQYATKLQEAAYHKQRASTITESFKKDIALAKQSTAMSKLSGIKKQIKHLI